MGEVVGIESLKAEVAFGFAVAQAVKAALADGKLGLDDLAQVLPLVAPAQKAFDARLQLGAELKDLSVEEATQLAALIAADLGVVADAALVAKVAAVSKALIACYEAAKAF